MGDNVISNPKINNSISALKYNTNIFLSFPIVGIFLMYILGKKNGGGIYGYGLITFSLFGLLVFEMAARKQMNPNKVVFKYIMDVFNKGGPIMLLITCSGWLLGINIGYKNIIESDKLPTEYNNFQFLGLFILLTELYLLSQYLNDQNKIYKSGGDSITGQLYQLMGKNLYWLMTLLSVLLLIIIGIMQVIVEYFTTDG